MQTKGENKGLCIRKSGLIVCGLKFAAVVFGAAMLLPMSAVSANVHYRWKTAADGNWNDKANWEYSSEANGPWSELGEDIPVPNGSENYVKFSQVGTYTVTLNNDVLIAQIIVEGGSGSNIVRPTFNLNGHELKVWRSNASFGNLHGGPNSRLLNSLSYPNTVWTFTNGSLYSVNNTGRLQGGNNGGNIGISHGAYVFDNVSFLLKGGISWYGDFRIFIQNGTVFTNVAEVATYTNDDSIIPKVWRPELCVRGSGSEFYSQSLLKLGNNEAGLYSMSGALVDVSALVVGANAAAPDSTKKDVCSTNCFAFATNGTIKVRGDLELGSDYEMCVGPHLKIMGKNGVIMQTEAEGILKIYENTGAHIDITISEDGFVDDADVPRAPLQVNDIAFIVRNEGKTQCEAFKLNVIGAADWLKEHPDEKLVLVELSTANQTVLERIKDVVVSDVDASMFKVSSDCKKLVLGKPRGLVINLM